MMTKEKMKYLLIAALFISCSTSNKIAVRYNKNAPVHYEKYKEVDGKLFVRGREVKLIPGTCVYANKK